MKRLLLLIFLLMTSNSLMASQWFFIDSSKEGEVYFVDASTIKPMKDGLTSAWVKADLLKPKWQGLFKESAKRYMDNVIFDCNNEKFATTDRVIYSASGNSLDSQHWPANFISAAPGTIAAKMGKITCEKSASLGKGESISGLPDNSLSGTSWKQVSQDPNSIVYLGMNNFEWGTAELENAVFFLVRTDYKQQRLIGTDAYKNYIVQWVGHCDTQNMLITQDIYYALNGQVVARGEYEVKSDSAMKASPDTLGMEFIKTACTQFKKTDNQSNKSINPPKTPSAKNQNFSSGTAWQVSNNQLVTAYHVVDGAKSMAIAIPDGTYKQVRVIASDPSNDLALVQIIEGSLTSKPLQLATKQPLLGSKVAVIGFPLSDILGVKVQATSGEISKLAGIMDDLRFFQVSAAVQSGNSGGPLLNQNGEVIGVVSSKLNALHLMKEHGEVPQNVNFAVKYPYISALLESANITPIKTQKKTNKIEDAITQSKESVYLLFVASDSK